MTAQIIPVDPDGERTLARYANEIRTLRKRASSDIFEIGRMLIESKKVAGHGNWLSWLEREFQWTDDTALNYMRVYDLVKNRNFRDLSNIPVSGLFLLAAPSTPEAAKQEAISRAEAGEPIQLNTVKEIVGRAKAGEDVSAKGKRKRKLLKAGTIVEVPLKYARLIGGTYRGPIEHITDCGGNCDRMPDGNYHYTINVRMIVSGEHLKWVRKAEEQVGMAQA